MRVRTFKDHFVILDEAQNATFDELKMVLTRLGMGSKFVIAGDPAQSDLRESGLMQIIRSLEHLDGIGVVEFTSDDVLRHPLVQQIINIL